MSFFFDNCLMKHKSPNLLKPLGIIIQTKLLMLPLLRADLLISVHSETPCMTKAYFIQALGRTSGSLIFGCQFIFVHIGKFEQEKMSMYLLKFYSKKDPIKIDVGIFQKFIPCYIWTPSTYLCLDNVSRITPSCRILFSSVDDIILIHGDKK